MRAFTTPGVITLATQVALADFSRRSCRFAPTRYAVSPSRASFLHLMQRGAAIQASPLMNESFYHTGRHHAGYASRARRFLSSELSLRSNPLRSFAIARILSAPDAAWRRDPSVAAY